MSFQFHQVSYAYDAKAVLRQVNFEFASGSVSLLRGESGSGKTTFLKLAAGLLAPQAGHISWQGSKLPVELASLRDWRKQNVAYLDQDSSVVTHWSLGENLALASSSPSDMIDVLSQLDLHLKLDQIAGSLSGGERQRLALARILLQPRPILLLDEPTSHLDDKSLSKVMAALMQTAKGRTMIIVSHDRRLEKDVPNVLLWGGAK